MRHSCTENHALYLSDLIYLLRSAKKRAFFFSIALLVFFLSSWGISPLQFQAEALFKEVGERNKTSANLLQNLLPEGVDLSKNEMQAATLMKSKKILKKVVERLGLQAEKESSWLSRYKKNWISCFRAALGFPLKEEEEFSFSNLCFLSEQAESYYLYFHSPTSFDLIDKKGEVLANGSVGKELLLPSLRFTLNLKSSKVQLHKNFPIVLHPWLDKTNALAKKMAILPDKNNSSFLKLTLFYPDRNLAIKVLNQTMKEYESYLQEEHRQLGEGQISYLESRLAHFTSEMKKTLQEPRDLLANKAHGTKDPDKEKMDGETARKLFFAYTQLLEASQLKQEECARMQKELFDPHFAVSALSTLFEDSATQDLIKRVTLLSLHLLDEKNYTSKERERFGEEIAVQKKLLFQHLHELEHREELKSAMFKEKIHTLQEILLDCLQTDTGLKIIERLSENIENKTLLLHLQGLESKTIDSASAAQTPKMFSLSSTLFLSLVLGFFLAFLTAFFEGAWRGFPLSRERLFDLGFSVLGPIASRDAERTYGKTLQKLAFFLETNQRGEKPFIVSILANEGPNYSHSLADLLSQIGKKVLLFDISVRKEPAAVFCPPISESPQCCIERCDGFDLLVRAENSSHSLQLSELHNFRAMIACLKEKYDAILLFNDSSLKNMEPQIFLTLSDFLLLTYEKETLLELKPFTDWANSDKKNRLMLIEKKSEV